MANDRELKYSSFAWTLIGIMLITGIVEIVTTEDFHIDQYLGCFYDGETQPGAQSRSGGFSNATLTIDICILHCRMANTKYAILQNGTDCRCSNNYGGSQVSDSFCKRACGGNVSHDCGGTYENGNSTYVLYTVCPIGTYGLTCGEACHCKSQVPCNRQTGTCPDGCHGNYTGAQCNRLTSFSDQYIGCYRDKNYDRAMEMRNNAGGRNTLQYCLDLCSSKYSYAGPQFGGECWCGESYDKHGRNESGCNSPCPGNGNQICGGGGALSVYNTCPTGNYGPKCAKVCNCEGRCHFKNGTCLTTRCKPGWTGNACNIRDINECLETPNICGPFAISCNNTEGGYTCHCMIGNVVQNSVCIGLPANQERYREWLTVSIAVAVTFIASCLLFFLFARLRRRRLQRNNLENETDSRRRSAGKKDSTIPVYDTIQYDDYSTIDDYFTRPTDDPSPNVVAIQSIYYLTTSTNAPPCNEFIPSDMGLYEEPVDDAQTGNTASSQHYSGTQKTNHYLALYTDMQQSEESVDDILPDDTVSNHHGDEAQTTNEYLRLVDRNSGAYLTLYSDLQQSEEQGTEDDTSL